MQALDDYIKEIKSLPAAPRVLSQLLVLLQEADCHSEQIVEIIRFDQAMTAKLLRRCNSAASGLAVVVSNVDDAVSLVGFDNIYRLVAMVIGEGLLSSEQEGYGIRRGELWEHSVTTAVSARMIAGKLGGEANSVFTAGLLHDIGKLVLGAFLEGSQGLVVNQTGPSGRSFLEAEKTILGVDHAEIGGRVLEQWEFPENLIQAVRHHHQPAKAKPHEELAAYVHLGDIIAHCLGQAQGFESFAIRTNPEALEILAISPRDIDLLVLETEGALKECTGLFQTTK